MRRLLPWLLALLVIAAAGGSVAWRFLTEERHLPSDTKSVSMEVINGAGVARVARAVADELQLRGYDVYGVGSTPERYERTTVADLRDPAGARAGNVARSLAVRRRWWRFYHGPWLAPDTTVAIDSSRYIDVRLIVGDDYQTYFPQVIPLY
jgi:hypothetical protein